MRFARFCLFLLGLLFLLGMAQAKPKKLTQAELQFNNYVGQATESFKLQDFKRALEGYQEAYKIDAVPALLLAMGQCYRALEQYEAAKNNYRQYLKDSPNAADKNAVEETIKELDRLIALGALEFESDPGGAKLYIDNSNEPKGETKAGEPLVVTGLEPGEHSIKVTKEGFKTFERKFKLAPGQRQLLGATLEPLLGTIEIVTEQEGVEVFFNGASKGTTKKAETLVITKVPLGEPQLLQFKKETFKSQEDNVTLAPGQKIVLSPLLEPGFGEVKIKINLRGADVSIGSTHKAVTNSKGQWNFKNVPAGKHVVKISLPPFQESTQNIVVGDGEAVPVEAVFSDPPLPKLLYSASGATFITGTILAGVAFGILGDNAESELGFAPGGAFFGASGVSALTATALVIRQRIKKTTASSEMEQQAKEEKKGKKK